MLVIAVLHLLLWSILLLIGTTGSDKSTCSESSSRKLAVAFVSADRFFTALGKSIPDMRSSFLLYEFGCNGSPFDEELMSSVRVELVNIPLPPLPHPPALLLDDERGASASLAVAAIARLFLDATLLLELLVTFDCFTAVLTKVFLSDVDSPRRWPLLEKELDEVLTRGFLSFTTASFSSS